MKCIAIHIAVFICTSLAFALEVVTTLPEVVIQSTPTGMVRTFTRQEIAKSGARNAAEFLKLMPGIAIRSDAASGGSQFARMGGSNVNQVMVLLDGIRISDVGSGESDLSRIPAEWIELIEVSNGGNTSSGGEAIGGVISIRTSDVLQDHFIATARGSETQTEVGARRDWMKGRTGAIIGVTREQGSGAYRFRITEDDGNGPFTFQLGETFRRQNNALVRDRLFSKITHDFGHHKFHGSAWLDRSDFGLPGYLAPRPTPLASQEAQFQQVQFGWTYDSSIGMFSTSAGLQNQRREFSDPDPFSYLHQSHEASQRVSMSTSLQHVVRNVSINWNARAERERLESGVLENSDATRNRWQTSVQAEKQLKIGAEARQAVNLLVGTSFERFGNAKMQALPSGQLSYSNLVVFPISIGIRRSQAYLAPSFYSLFWNDELLAQGNPDLRPESSEMWQAFLYTATLNRYETAIRMNASHNNIDDLIYWRQAFDGRWTPQNLRKATLNQLTVAFEQVILPSYLDFEVSMAWLDARDHSGERVTDGKYLIYRPLRTFRGKLNGTAFGCRALLQAMWVDKQAVLETNSKWLADFTLIDAEVTYAINFGSTQWDVGVRCENVLDVDYRVVRFAPMPLREFSVFLSCNLGSQK